MNINDNKSRLASEPSNPTFSRPWRVLSRVITGNAGDAYRGIARVHTNNPAGSLPVSLAKGPLELFKNFHALAQKENKPAAYGWLGPQLVIYARDPKVVYELPDSWASRVGPDTTGPFGGMHRIVGDSIVTTTGSVWRNHRQLVKAAMTSQSTANAFPEVQRVVREHLTHWHAGVDDLARDCTFFAL